MAQHIRVPNGAMARGEKRSAFDANALQSGKRVDPAKISIPRPRGLETGNYDNSLGAIHMSGKPRQHTGTLTRRHVLAGASGLLLASGFGFPIAAQVVKDSADLKPGEYTWHPERSTAGPVAIIVSIPEQRVHVYRNGVRMAVSTCSTGKPGHETPTGIFTVLQKDKHHRSSTYNNAPMPNMNRLTWSGIALHAGKLPGYPASHGCVRLPLEFSEKLFEITHLGTPVIISGARTDPWEIIHPGMVLAGYAEDEFTDVVSQLEGKKHPADWSQAESYPITTMIASTADRTIELLENGDVIAKGTLTVKGSAKVGEHVFVLQGSHGGNSGMAWHGITHHEDPAHPLQSEDKLIQRLTADPGFVKRMRASLHPGMVFIVTDLPLTPDRRSGHDFVIMNVGA